MTWLALYFVLLKGTITSFAGFTSLPVIREDLVAKRRILTDAQVDRAVAVARATPGPMGLHVVSIGFQAGGWAGALAGWLAMITPALLVSPMMELARRLVRNPRIRSSVNAVVIASSALLVSTTVSLAGPLIQDRLLVAVTIASAGVLCTTRYSVLYVMAGAGILIAAGSGAGFFRIP